MSHATIDPIETLSETELDEHHAHVSPFWSMLWVFIILLILTALTVWTSRIHEIPFGHSVIEIGGTLHIFLAMGIAIVKSVLVAAFFMHLKYDKPMNTVIVGATIFAVILFIGLTLADSATRQVLSPTETSIIVPGGTKKIVETARINAEQAASNPDAAHDAPADATKPAEGTDGH